MVNAAYELVCGERQPTSAITPPGYYGTDAGHLLESGGMEGVVCGPGGRYNTMPDERVDIVDFMDAVRTIRWRCSNLRDGEARGRS